jgi:hypothetical protein
MPSRLVSKKAGNDLEFEWLLCLSSTVKALRDAPNVTDTSSDIERLLHLTKELQDYQLRKARESRGVLQPLFERLRGT